MFGKDLSFKFEVSTLVALGISTLFVIYVVQKLIWVISNKRVLEFASGFPGFKFYPIVGNGIHFYGKNSYEVVQLLFDKFGSKASVWMGHTYYYLTADSDDIKTLLNSPNSLEKMEIYDDFKYVFGEALFLAPVSLWKKNRKYLNKGFNKPVLDSFMTCFNSNSQSSLKVLADMKGKNLCKTLQRSSLATFCETMLKLEYDVNNPANGDLVLWAETLQKLGTHRLTHQFVMPKWAYFFFTWKGLQQVYVVYKLRKAIKNMVKENFKQYAENPPTFDAWHPQVLIDLMLLGTGKIFSKEYQIEELTLITLAAINTSGLTLGYLFFFLGMHPDIQEKVYEETIDVVGESQNVEAYHLSNLKMTERVIQETLRVLPAVPFIGRMTTENVNVGSKIIPKGTNIFISILHMHRNEKYWPNPLKFDPDRFLPEEVAKRNPNCFMPFSDGPRNCIGRTFAMMLLKVYVANIIRHYKIYAPYMRVEDMRFYSYVTLEPLHKMDCTFTPRSKVAY